MTTIEILTARREKISFLNGLVEGMRLAVETRELEEFDKKLEKYRKEIDSLNDQIEQEAVNK